MNIPDFSAARVLVAGDVMIDIEWTGRAARLSPEAPVPVLSDVSVTHALGGAGNAAANCARLGAATTLAGIVGRDHADEVRDLAERYGIVTEFVESRTGVTKLRLFADAHALLRVDHDADLSANSMNLGIRLRRLFDSADVLLLSDYGKGSLAAVPHMIAAARAAGVPVVVDPKGMDFERYAGATLLKPNRAEFDAVAGASADELDFIDRARAMRRRLGLDALLVTQAAEGMTLFMNEAYYPLRIPAYPVAVHDVTGAGDTVAAVMACGLAVGQSFTESARLAALAASVAVSFPGTAPVSARDLEIVSGGGQGRVLDQDAAARIAADVRARGETLVVANGCFDLLHSGHLSLLRYAKAQGDRLLVAINDDASVARLKGKDRPAQPLEDRAAVLAALGDVDMVVPFGDDSPASLLALLRPDVLVKGEDWSGRDVAGAEHCGRVAFAPLQPGRSTTSILQRVRHA